MYKVSWSLSNFSPTDTIRPEIYVEILPDNSTLFSPKIRRDFDVEIRSKMGKFMLALHRSNFDVNLWSRLTRFREAVFLDKDSTRFQRRYSINTIGENFQPDFEIDFRSKF